MKKQGLKNKSWKTRYCVLNHDVLSYFKTQTDSYPKGKLVVECDTVIMFVGEIQLEKKNAFAVITKKRTYYMIAGM